MNWGYINSMTIVTFLQMEGAQCVLNSDIFYEYHVMLADANGIGMDMTREYAP